ncbi:MAG: hypothetical protein H6548_03285 [Chitinophagales bacterium]|nr:hypothetical protein [Chitinophagales bacterium]HAE13174.1 hypothetical protein [Bacteroidota bacterium]MCB9019659.1 hypothetical protein [Chitinophagales bacterium]MCB9021118.1 hypothetical protein [Chitinophagales bacterium]HPE96493.1 hypothetical protein [Chitinophagales bacterium]
MKIRNLAIIFSLGLLVASCTDKKAAEEIEKLKMDMAAADSLCQADKAMLMDSIANLHMMWEEMSAPANKTSSGSTKSSTSTTTTTTDTKSDDKSVNDRGGSTQVEKKVTDRGGSDAEKTVKKDINKRGGN